MQLRTARLCHDCEEIHDRQQCPVCASEAFTYITRWVPVPERRIRARETPAGDAEAYRRLAGEPARSTSSRLLNRAAVGLTVAGVVGWLWGRRHQRRAASDDDD